MGPDVAALFEVELRRRGLAFTRTDDGRYRVAWRGGEADAPLEALAGQLGRAGDAPPDRVARRFVDELDAAHRAVPPWEAAAPWLFLAPEAAARPLADAVRAEISPELACVVTLTDEAWAFVRPVTTAMCAAWGVSPEEAAAAALANQDRLLDGVAVEAVPGSDGDLGFLDVASPYRAAVVFAPRLREVVAPALGWPVAVVLPCRDFLVVARLGAPALEELGDVVVREHGGSAYPLSTEVLIASDDGLRAIGRFAPDAPGGEAGGEAGGRPGAPSAG